MNSRHRVSKVKSGREKKKSVRIETKVYKAAIYPVDSTLWYLTVLAWDPGRLVAGIRSITFGHDFEVRDSHLNDIVATGPALCNSLQHLCCSQATFLSDTSLAKLVTACPNLVHVEIENGIRITDSAVLTLVRHCANLKFLGVAGGRELRGKVGGSIIERMMGERNLGRRLEKMCFANQEFLEGDWESLIRDLSRSRKKVTVEISDGGGRKVRTWSGGKEQLSEAVQA